MSGISLMRLKQERDDVENNEFYLERNGVVGRKLTKYGRIFIANSLDTFEHRKVGIESGDGAYLIGKVFLKT